MHCSVTSIFTVARKLCVLFGMAMGDLRIILFYSIEHNSRKGFSVKE